MKPTIPLTKWAVTSGCVNALTVGIGITACLDALGFYSIFIPMMCGCTPSGGWAFLNLLAVVLLGVVVLVDMVRFGARARFGPLSVCTILAIAFTGLMSSRVDVPNMNSTDIFIFNRRVYLVALMYGLLRWLGNGFKLTVNGGAVHPGLRRESLAGLITREHLFATAYRVSQSTVLIGLALMFVMKVFVPDEDFTGKYVVYFYSLFALFLVSGLVLFRGLGRETLAKQEEGNS